MQSQPTLMHWKNVKLENVVLDSAKTNQNGGKSVEIRYRNHQTGVNEKLWINGPKMRIPFGITSSAMFNSDRGAGASAPNMTLDLSLVGLRNGDPEMIEFEEFCKNWDELVSMAAVQNSGQWFGKEKSTEFIKEVIKPFVKEGKDMKYDPTIRLKLPKRYGKYDFLVFDETRTVVQPDDCLLPGNEVVPIFELKNLWFMGNSFGTAIYTQQLMCFVKDELTQCIIINDPTTHA